jgi:hypothetical protein
MRNGRTENSGTVKWEAEGFDNFSGNKMTPVTANRSFSIIESTFWEQKDSVTAHHRFPIQAVVLIQDFFNWLWAKVHLR